jgi:hypothetical protein
MILNVTLSAMFVSGVTMIFYFNYLTASSKNEMKKTGMTSKFKEPANSMDEDVEKRVVA